MTEKTVTFQDKQGRNIVGTMLTPEGNGLFPAVIICHGFKGHRNSLKLKEVADELLNHGIASLRFDFFNAPGESSVPFEEMTLSYELEILDQAVAFVKTLKEIDADKTGLTGHSLGGLVVAWYSSYHPEVKSLAVLSAVYNFLIMWKDEYGEGITQEMKEKGFAYVYSDILNKDLKLKLGFYIDAENYDMDKVINNINCPLFILHGTKDEAVTLEHAQHFYDRSQSPIKEVKIIKGADHNYTKPGNLDEVKTVVASWFKKTLG